MPTPPSFSDEAKKPRFADLAERTQAAFRDHYVNDDGIPTMHKRRTRWPSSLAFLIRSLRGWQGSGWQNSSRAGTASRLASPERRMSWTLSSTGRLEEAYRLLLQQECPSWLYTVTMGATTIWERWDSMLPDGTINPGQMTSFNHYALGAVADWMHRNIGGIAPLEPGYSRC